MNHPLLPPGMHHQDNESEVKMLGLKLALQYGMQVSQVPYCATIPATWNFLSAWPLFAKTNFFLEAERR